MPSNSARESTSVIGIAPMAGRRKSRNLCALRSVASARFWRTIFSSIYSSGTSSKLFAELMNRVTLSLLPCLPPRESGDLQSNDLGFDECR